MSKEDRLIKQITPIGSIGQEALVFPNNSGDHVRSIKRDAPVNDMDLVNKAYVDAHSGGGHIIKEEGGADLPTRRNINFVGASVTATDNAGTNSTDVTIAAGGVGDMTKAVYDTDNDGRVELAKDSDTVDSKHAADFDLAGAGTAAVAAHNLAFTHADIALNTAARHSQNTDSGTTGNTFTVDSDSATGKIIIDVALGAANKSLTLTNTALTDNRTATFKDADGTVAYTSDLHTRQHSITQTLDHTSTATPGKILKADANGLPVDATNTDAQVSAAVTASHGVNDANTSSIAKSLLTEQGDVIYASGASTPAALAHGNSGEFLKTQGHGANPVWAAIDDTTKIAKSVLSEQGSIIYASAASTPAELLHGTAGQVLQSGGHAANPSWLTHYDTKYIKVAEYIGSVGDITDVDFSSLDLGTDNIYVLYYRTKNAGSTQANLSLYVNGDYTATNYEKQSLTASSTTLTGARANDGIIAVAYNNTKVVEGVVWITINTDTYARAISESVENTGSALQMRKAVWEHLSTGNVTSMRFHSSYALEGAKTQLFLYKIVR